MRFIPINIPILGKEEKEAVMAVLDSGLLTNASYEGGKCVKEFEGKLRAKVGTRHAIAVNSGTAALHTSLVAYGIGRGDEVIVPAFTFEATANVVLAAGAKPVFADIKDDYNIDPADVRRKVTKRTKAIIPVDVYGYPADLDEVREIADRRSLKVIEDAAESLGAEYKGRPAGKTDHAGCFSLYATKVITSGEGGAITTDDDEFADRARLVRNHGMRGGYDTSVLGFNYRMPEVLAAIASVQMDRLEGYVEARRRNARALGEGISSLKGVRLAQLAPDRKHVWYLYTVLLAKGRDEVMKRLRDAGVGAAVYWETPVNRMPLYKKLGYGTLKLPKAYRAAAGVLSLPVHPGVTQEEINMIAEQFVRAVKSA
ncbi:MAG TPA: DegT/DnrJ/EryC1/StrS family aminotransferase [Nitrososphaerales archaeon]|nr:DegT/DnrJ/EryC1/StrS family aminotransferase [Nitrososphaerales archaeon]